MFANLPAGPDGNYTFTWSGPNSFVSNEENPIVPEADTSYSGTYQLIVQSGNGCVSTGSINVLIEALNAPSITVSSDTLCVGEEIILSTQLYSGSVSYQWYQVLPSGDTLLGNTSEPQLTYIPLVPGTYSVYAVVSQDTCTSEPGVPVEFVVVSVPVASILDPGTIYCVTDTLFLIPETEASRRTTSRV